MNNLQSPDNNSEKSSKRQLLKLLKRFTLVSLLRWLFKQLWSLVVDDLPWDDD